MNSSSNDPTRRDFLHQVGATIAAAGAASAGLSSLALGQNSPSTQSDDRKAGYAMVGLGSFCLNQLIPGFAAAKKSKLVALVSGHPDKAKRIAEQHGVAAKNIYNYDNYDSIKDNPEVDVIYIVLPNCMHAEYVIRGAKAGKHIMCEKPMAVSVEECQAMVDACKAANRKLMIGYRSQYEPHNLRAIQMIRDGQIGKLITIVADAGFMMRDPTVWRLNKKLAGGGPLMDIGIYALQACRYLSGEEPIEINAMTHTTPDDPRFKEVEETCAWQMRFPSGVLANCTTSYNYSGQNRHRAVGTTGSIDMEPATGYGGNKLTLHARGKPPELIDIADISQFAAEMDHFSDCVLNNKTPKTPGEEGLRDVRLMMAIYEAAASGKTVKV
ncbi:MAG TPA: Gfo/Idh/MocA family oxidoreductase [Tepidisphaeraceae bacterium]